VRPRNGFADESTHGFFASPGKSVGDDGKHQRATSMTNRRIAGDDLRRVRLRFPTIALGKPTKFLYISVGASALLDPSRRRCLRDDYQEIHAEDESRNLGIGHRGRFPQCLTEGAEINERPIGFQHIGKNGLEITGVRIVFQVECPLAGGLANSRVNSVRVFHGHDADVQGLGAAGVREFGDIVPDAASVRGVESAVYVEGAKPSGGLWVGRPWCWRPQHSRQQTATS